MYFRITTLQLHQNPLALLLQRVVVFAVICTLAQYERIYDAQQRILREVLLRNFHGPVKLADFGNVNATCIGLQIGEIEQIAISEVR